MEATNNNISSSTTNTTIIDARTAAAALLSLDTGSWFVLAVTLCVFFGPLFVLFPPFPPRRSDALWQTHTKLSTAKPSSKPKGRDATKSITTHVGSGIAEGNLESLCLYPVESLTGIEVTRAKVTSTGLEFDRLYTLAQLKSPFPVSVQQARLDDAAAKNHRWESITPRQFPLLSTVQVELWQPDLDKLKGLNGKNAQSNSEAFLILRFPWRETGFFGLWDWFAAKCLRGWKAMAEKEVLLPVEFPPAEDIAAKGYAREMVRLSSATNHDNGNDHEVAAAAAVEQEEEALDMSVELPEELRLYLGVSNKLGLFRAAPDPAASSLVEVPPVNKKNRSSPLLQVVGSSTTPSTEKAGYLAPVVGFHDSYPVHIVNVSSGGTFLASRAATKDEEPKSWSSKWRGANVFVSGLPANDEDQWKEIKVKPKSSLQDSDVTFRGGPEKNGLGVKMVPLFDKPGSSHGFLEVGMSVEVLERW